MSQWTDPTLDLFKGIRSWSEFERVRPWLEERGYDLEEMAWTLRLNELLTGEASDSLHLGEGDDPHQAAWFVAFVAAHARAKAHLAMLAALAALHRLLDLVSEPLEALHVYVSGPELDLGPPTPLLTLASPRLAQAPPRGLVPDHRGGLAA